MPNKIDLKGKTFGRLIMVKESDHRNRSGSVTWECLCTCGKTTVANSSSLRNKKTKSCGCISLEKNPQAVRRNPLYKVYKGIKQRCYNPKQKNYKHYGGRGIVMCKTWLSNFRKFEGWCLENGYKKGLQIDRINNDKGYSPKNCRFVTQRTNTNNRSVTIMVKYRGKSIPFSELHEIKGVTIYETALSRYKRGWTLKESMLTPARGYPS